MVRMVPRNQQRSRSCKNLRARFQGRERCRLLGEGLERGVVASPSTLAVERVGVCGHPTITVPRCAKWSKKNAEVEFGFLFQSSLQGSFPTAGSRDRLQHCSCASRCAGFGNLLGLWWFLGMLLDLVSRIMPAAHLLILRRM